MKRTRTLLSSAFDGALYVSAALFASALFLKNLGSLFAFAAGYLNLSESVSLQVEAALSQLTEANLAFPYVYAVLIGFALGFLWRLVFKKRTLLRKILRCFFLPVLFVPFTLLMALLTYVNDILFLDIIRLLVSIAANL